MKFQEWISTTALAALVAAGVGCGKQIGTPAANSSNNANGAQIAQAAQAIPFAEKKTAAPNSSDQLAGEQEIIPSGTAITVRLQNAVSSATSRPGDEFEAT